MSLKPLLPGALSDRGQQMTLGVMGGGQLGRMFVQAAQAMGYFTAVLDPDPASPAGLISHFHIQTPYDDEQGLAQLMQRCDAITTEFENVPAGALFTLGAHRPVAPSSQCVATAQDRVREKAHFVRSAPTSGVQPAPYAAIETPELLAAAPADLLPGILKTSRMGYDGKGQIRVADRAALAAAWDQLGRVPCVLEKLLPLKAECSVIVARGADGQSVSFPVQANTHRDGILALTAVYDGAVPAALAERARASTVAIANHLNYVGVLCVEYFLVDDGQGGRYLRTFLKKGCDVCEGRGLKGRLGIYELMLNSDEIRHHIRHRSSAGDIRASALQAGMKTLRQDGIDKVVQGLTDLSEVIAATNL